MSITCVSVLCSMKQQLVVDVSTAVQREMDSALEGQRQVMTEQIEALRSAAATPAPDSIGFPPNIKVCILMYHSA